MEAGSGDDFGGFGGKVFGLGAVIIADKDNRFAGDIGAEEIVDNGLGDEPDIRAGKRVGDNAAPSISSERDLRLLGFGHGILLS
jgi:hypothetical protein